MMLWLQVAQKMSALQEAMKDPAVQQQMAEMQAAMQSKGLQERMAQLKASNHDLNLSFVLKLLSSLCAQPAADEAMTSQEQQHTAQSTAPVVPAAFQ